MGTITRSQQYRDEDYLRFTQRLHEQLFLLKQQINSGQLDGGAHSIGAELELYLVDQHCRPLGRNRELLAQLNDPHLQLELNRFNLEYNLPPRSLAGSVFSDYARETQEMLRRLDKAANKLDGQVLAVGILPTLRPEDFNGCMTDSPRYQALADGLRRIRGEPFRVAIAGEQDQLETAREDVALEGANTSWQLHLRVGAQQFADWYNAIQLVTPLALAMAGNSPLLFGKRLWEETRVALFRQSIDSRSPERHEPWRQPARVSFGEGWLRDGAWELFASTVALYPPILPECRDGATDQLSELRLHAGTVWHWNRPVYDPVDGGHLRIEMRALPAGPSALDMAANSAFLIGAAAALLPRIRELISALPFRYCEYNFVTAARQGLQARLLWPHQDQIQLADRPVADIILELLPAAARALEGLGINSNEASAMQQLLATRIEQRQTGSSWLSRGYQRSDNGTDNARQLMQLYHDLQIGGQPLHLWPSLPGQSS